MWETSQPIRPHRPTPVNAADNGGPRHPAPADRAVTPAPGQLAIRAEWMGLPADLLVGQVAATGPGCAVRPGTRVLVRHRGEPGTVVVDEVAVTLLPVALEPSIAVLAGPLAVARRAVEEVPGDATRVLIAGYDEVGALVHAELVRRTPAVAVTVLEDRPRVVALARAFGAVATTSATGTFDVVMGTGAVQAQARTRIDVGFSPEPDGIEIAAALDILASETWRFLPLITDGLTADELDLRSGDPSPTAPRDSVVTVVSL